LWCITKRYWARATPTRAHGPPLAAITVLKKIG
jgi:hypothetical protein